MKSAKSKQRTKILSISIVIIILVAGLLVWRHFKYKMADQGIQEAVSGKSHGLYQLTYDSMRIDEVSGSMDVKNIQLTADTAMYNEMETQKKNPPIIVNVNVPHMHVGGIKTPKAILTKEISGARIELFGPTIELLVSEFLKDTSGYSPGKEIYRQILGEMKSIKIDTILINHGTLIVKDMHTGKLRFKGLDVSVLLTALEIDSATQNDSSRILFSRNLDLSCRDISIGSKDKKYIVGLQGLEYSSTDDRFSIHNIDITPQLSEEAFTRSLSKQKDRYNITMSGIHLTGIQREALWQKKIVADSLIIGQSSFKIYRDISLPHDSLNRVGKFPHQMLMDLPLPVYIKTMWLQSSFVEYKEKNAKTDSSGKVQFWQVRASIHNTTNMASRIRANNACILDFNSMFLNRVRFKAKWTMYLKDPDGKFHIEGKMGSIPVTSLNQLTEPMALTRLEQGTIDNLSFSYNGANYYCNGEMRFLYHGLKVGLLKKNDDVAGYKKKKILSMGANILVRDANQGSPETTSVHVEYERDKYRSVFNLMWKTTLSGLKKTAESR